MVTIEVLNEQIKQLTLKIDEGFTGVYARQDKTNGNISHNSGKIVKLEKEDIEINNRILSCSWQQKIYWGLVTVLISIILCLLGAYVY